MTLKKEKKTSTSKKVGNKTTAKTITSTEEAPKSQVRIPSKVSKEPKHSDKLDTGQVFNQSEEEESCKLDRKPSLRRKLGALIKGSAELPAAINRSLQPIRRSLSFSKDLNRTPENKKQPYRTRSVQWCNSLSSLAENDPILEDNETFISEEELFPGKVITRTHSLLDKYPTVNFRRRAQTLYEKTAPYGRHSDHYDSSIDLSNPPCEASSPPVLTQAVIDEDASEIPQVGWENNKMEQQVKNGWGHLRSSARNLSILRFGLQSPKQRGNHSVRSRSLTQLDALGSSMLDTEEHHLGGSPQQSHHPHSHHSQNLGECSPRFLVPSETEHSNRNRHKLSKSQVSSSEYFSVSFEIGDDAGALDQEEFLPATKGIYLAEALSGACERRGVDLSRVDVFLDSFLTPLPILTTETSCLGGKHLRIAAKNDKLNSKITNQRNNQNVSLRKASGSYRGRSGRFFSVSTEDSSVDSDLGTASTITSGKSSAGAAALKASKQRWSGFFTNTKGTKMESLVEQLNSYTKHGIPRLSDVSYDLIVDEEALYALENDWRDIVENSELLSEKQQQQQTALWELAQTEVAYIRTLKVVTDLFMACLCSLQASNILNDVDRTKLFRNIPDLYAANSYFWSEHLLTMLNSTRSTRQPLEPCILLQGFETFENTFAPYTRYCSEQSKCQQYCRDRLNDNELFTAYLVWCETQKDCNRLRLLDILVKPMQRLTKYSLLLKAVHKNTESEDQRAKLTIMIKSVDNFVASVNAALKRSEETARLVSAASRLDSYDVVESRDEELDKLIKIHSSLDITNSLMPGCSKDALRTLLREGDLKLRDAATSKTEVHVYLLTDMLLICKPSTKKSSSSSGAGSSVGGLKIIRQPYVVDRIRVYELKESTSLGLVYVNEYGAASAALVLSASEPKLAKSWMESLRKAQQQFVLMKLPSLGSTFGRVSRQPSTFLGDGDFEMEESEAIPRTPRGSSRGSRVSSLAHSHSGSMEMEGASPSSSSFLPSYNASRNVSMETTEPPRASSVSSEEGGEIGSGHNQRPLQIR